jgi:hypothetical protein
MTNIKAARFRVDAYRETGELMLLIETQCGYRPVMGWPDIASLREFAEMLMNVCSSIKSDGNTAAEIADKLVEEVFNDKYTD